MPPDGVALAVALLTRRALIFAGCFLAPLGGCSDGSSASWTFEARASIGESVETIEASILEGGCSSTDAVYQSRFQPGEVAAMPPTLGRGRYGFQGRGFDDECREVAFGCVDVELPTSSVIVTLRAGSGETEPECMTPLDGGMPDDLGEPSSFDPSNVSADLFVDDGVVEITGDETYDTDDCTSLPGSPMVVPQSDGPELCVQRAERFVITDSGELRVEGSRPLVWLAGVSVVIDGTLDASAHGQGPGPGGFEGATDGTSGQGPEAGADGAHVDTYDDGGGGGAGGCGDGARGGAGDAADGGEGGGLRDSVREPLRGGSGGGLGGGGESAGAGGAGGGALQISARQSITISGAVYVSGGGGEGGNDGTSDDANIGSGGGGGAGGTLLLEAPTVSIGSGATLDAAGGGGGGGASCRNAGRGANGEDGRPASARANGGRRGPACDGFTVGQDGGEGGGGTELAGAAGGDQVSDDGSGGNGGGGGGGVGCVLVRATSPVGNADRVNPSSAPGFQEETLVLE